MGISESSKVDRTHLRSDLPTPCKTLLFAIGLIALLGSQVLAGYLYSYVGLWALSLSGAGVLSGSGIIAFTIFLAEKMRKKAPLPFIAQSRILSKIDPELERALEEIELAPLPEEVPEYLDYLGKRWLSHRILYQYRAYLALYHPEIFACNVDRDYKTKTSINLENINDYVLNKLPQYTNDYTPQLDLPIFMSLLDNRHWSLVYIDRQRRTVEFYDSLPNDEESREEITNKLTLLAEELSKKEAYQAPYRFIWKIENPPQKDGFECGVWALAYLELRMENPNFDFDSISQPTKFIKEMRKKIIRILCAIDQKQLVTKELENAAYLAAYNSSAFKIKQDDVKKLPHVERMKRLILGQPLMPGEQLD